MSYPDGWPVINHPILFTQTHASGYECRETACGIIERIYEGDDFPDRCPNCHAPKVYPLVILAADDEQVWS